MGNQNVKGFRRLVNATVYSWQGIKATFRNEAAFRQEVFLSLFFIPGGLWLGENGLERAVLVGVVLIVFIVELLNSGIEALVDRQGDEIHKLSGMAKDMGSAAVLISLINVLVVWGLVLFT